MTLEEGIEIFVKRQQAAGMSFEKGHKTYRALLRMVGNVPLSEISPSQVSQFLDLYNCAAATFRRRHSLLRRFFEYWTAYGVIAPMQMPLNRPPHHSNYLPYIYTREEIRRVLQWTSLIKTSNDRIHHETVRAGLLTLYATGAVLSEVTRLGRDDVDLEKGTIRFSATSFKAGRRIPIGRDLAFVLRNYVAWRDASRVLSEFFFSRRDGGEVTARALSAYFGRCCRKARIDGYRGSSRRPCLRDLRTTHAVHQITSWLKKKRDLNLMLPALGTYMGNVGLEATEHYLQFAPERFQRTLDKLSSPRMLNRWCEDSKRLEFLASL